MSERKSVLPPLPWDMLPPRGTGLRLGTARPRSYPPLTEAERAKRHAGLFSSNPSLPNIDELLPALPPDLPLPRFLVKQMKR